MASLEKPETYPKAGWLALGALYLALFLVPPVQPAMGMFLLILVVGLAVLCLGVSMVTDRRHQGPASLAYLMVIFLLPVMVAGLASTLNLPNEYGRPWGWVGNLPVPALTVIAILALLLSILVGLWSVAVVERRVFLFYSEEVPTEETALEEPDGLRLVASQRDFLRAETASYLLCQNTLFLCFAAGLGYLRCDWPQFGVVVQAVVVSAAANLSWNLALAFLVGAESN